METGKPPLKRTKTEKWHFEERDTQDRMLKLEADMEKLWLVVQNMQKAIDALEDITDCSLTDQENSDQEWS